MTKGDDDPRGVANLDPRCMIWQDLCRVLLNIADTLNIQA